MNVKTAADGATGKAPLAPLELLPARLEVTRLDGGGMILRSPFPLEPYPRCLGEKLEHWAGAAPERVFLAERDTAGGWRTVTYAEARAAARALGQALLDRDLGPEHPVAILDRKSTRLNS